MKKFIEKYRKLYSEGPSSDAAFMYDDMLVLSVALKSCDSKENLDKDCVAEELLKIKYPGVAGMFAFDQDGVSQRPVILIQHICGKWQEIQ